MNTPPVLDAAPPEAEQRQLAGLFRDIEKGQLDLLDASGKRIIELSTGFIGVLFAVIALGEDFPPPYLNHNPAKLLVIFSLIAFLGAVLFGLLTIQPRSYRNFRKNLTEMEKELEKMINQKSFTLRFSGMMFFAGALCLCLLIVFLIVGAA